MNDKNNDLNFEQMMKERMEDDFGTAQGSVPSAHAERLNEMNKKLPAWNLEPPLTFIK